MSGVGRRFEHQLTADAHHLADATSVGSKIICCYTLGDQTAVLFLFLAQYYFNKWSVSVILSRRPDSLVAPLIVLHLNSLLLNSKPIEYLSVTS